MARPLIAGLVVLAAACARPYAPPGGDIAEVPPRVVATSPVPDTVVDGWRGAVVLRFEQRLSERGIQDAVVVSPVSGATRVSQAARGRELHVRVSDGWLPGEIYRIEVRPGLRDLFGNQLDEPIELFFSTGPELPETAVAGMVTDRLSGRAVERARVEAVRRPDSVTYLAFTDADGFFALRQLPPAEYDLHVYLDRNRNQQLDPGEPRDTGALELAPGDTALFALRLLAPDSTPARLARAVPEDSLTLRLSFDDHLDPERPLTGVGVTVTAADGAPVPVDTLLHRHEWDARREAEEEARREREAAERAARGEEEEETEEETEEEPPSELEEAMRVDGQADERAPTDRGAGGRPGRGAAGEPLPAQEMVVILRAPLRPGERYTVQVSALENIHGIPDGGGELELDVPQPMQQRQNGRDGGTP